MQFKINYEDVKRLLGIFYNSPYQVSAPYVELLHNLKDDNEGIFLTHLEQEKTLITAASQNTEASQPIEAKAE